MSLRSPRWIIYQLLFLALIPIFIARLFWRSRHEPRYRQRWLERLGYGLPKLKITEGKADWHCIWIHAVSVGEVIAAKPLIESCLVRATQVVVTTGTLTGSDRVKALFSDRVLHCYAPYDISIVFQRFFQHFKPGLCIVMETEIWPVWIHELHANQVPILLANARLSEKSLKSYKVFKYWITPSLQKYSLIAGQSLQDCHRFQLLGANAKHLKVVGNLKFDAHLPEDFEQRRQLLRQHWGRQRWVLVAASTHLGEDEIVLSVFKRIKELIPNALLILVPRHPERFETVFNQAVSAVREFGKVVRHSTHDPVDSNIAVVLGDTMGELIYFFGAADVAFVGGSMVPVGGHNVLEPMSASCPTIIGSHVFNFQAIVDECVEHGAIQQIQSDSELTNALITIFEKPIITQHQIDRAHQLLTQHRGALQKIENWIEHIQESIPQY
ncbi:MAG: lipid IV(A) 3-deoxy-D-manno-octulosonic acid transferase [Pseudomonadota bacterium]